MHVKFLTSFMSMFTYLFVTYRTGIIHINRKHFIRNLLIVYLIAGVGCINYEIFSIPLFLISMMILFYLENKKIIDNFISLIISVLIFLLSDTIQGTFWIKILHIDVAEILNNHILYIGMHLLLFLIAFVISSLIGLMLKKIKFEFVYVNIKSKFSKLILINISLTAIIFYVNAMIIKFINVNNFIILVDSSLFLLYFFSTMVLTCFVTINLSKEMDYQNKKKEFDNLQEYLSNLEIMYTDMRKFRHDYINIISSINGYIDDGDLNGLRKFFNTNILRINETILNKNETLDKLQNIKIPEIKGLISSKVIKAQELKIEVFIDIAEHVESVSMDIIDLCRAVGILLDNAIEAALLCESPVLKIGIIKQKKMTMILIINSCIADDLPIYKIFKKGYSTKGENRGLGLSNLNEILSKYPNIALDTSITDGEFIQNMQISNC